MPIANQQQIEKDVKFGRKWAKICTKAEKEGELFDLLLAVQSKLSRGTLGVDKPLSCSASVLSKIARLKPRSLNEMAKIIGPQKTDRFGVAFLDVLNEVT